MGDESACLFLLVRFLIPSILFLFLPLSISSVSSHSPSQPSPSLSFFPIPIHREHSTCILVPQTRLHHGSLPIAPHSRADAHRPPTSHDMSCVRIISTHIFPDGKMGQIVDAVPCQTPPMAAFLDVLYFCGLTLLFLGNCETSSYVPMSAASSTMSKTRASWSVT